MRPGLSDGNWHMCGSSASGHAPLWTPVPHSVALVMSRHKGTYCISAILSEMQVMCSGGEGRMWPCCRTESGRMLRHHGWCFAQASTVLIIPCMLHPMQQEANPCHARQRPVQALQLLGGGVPGARGAAAESEL